VDRRSSLNLSAFERYETVEIRLHQGTTSARKILPWVIFNMKIVEAVQNGLTHRDIEPDIDSVLDAVGMDETATRNIRNARDYLKSRYEHWMRDAEENGLAIPGEELDIETIERELENVATRARTDRLRHAVQREVVQRVCNRSSEQDDRSIQNLATIRPSSHLANIDQYVTDINGFVWDIPSNHTDRMFRVSRDSAPATVSISDTLACDCRRFRRVGSCYHSINVARFIRERLLESLIEQEIEARSATQTEAG
jgi:hypothetical protein